MVSLFKKKLSHWQKEQNDDFFHDSHLNYYYTLCPSLTQGSKVVFLTFLETAVVSWILFSVNDGKLTWIVAFDGVIFNYFPSLQWMIFYPLDQTPFDTFRIFFRF